MSQELYYREVSTVSEARNFERNFGPIVAQVLNSAPVEVQSGVKECSVKKYGKVPNLVAPTKLHEIQTDFDRQLTTVGRRQSAATQLKVAALATLVASQDNLAVSSPDAIVDHLQRIVESSNVESANREIKAAFKEIKVQHTQVFISNLATAVRMSAEAIGFRRIKVDNQSEDKVRIVSENSTGQNLIAEIAIGSTIDIHTELLGYTDGSCRKVMTAFDKELSSRGVSMETKTRNETNGVPQMPYSQVLVKKASSINRTFIDEESEERVKQCDTITIKQ